jgi:hypothetical protein
MVHDVLRSPGSHLDDRPRRFMEGAFGFDFRSVRVHTDAEAAASTRAVDAFAYTVGEHIVFANGRYRPDDRDGRRLLAHELSHVVQERRGGTTSTAAQALRVGEPDDEPEREAERVAEAVISGRSPEIVGRSMSGIGARGHIVRRTWDAAQTKCSGEPTDKWIERIEVKQEPKQAVVLHWSDGSSDSDQCSAGKGLCCVDPGSPGTTSCPTARSRQEGSHCTPVTLAAGYPVRNRVIDHKGIAWWTEFVPERGIALHQFSPVTGEALSHGCVRLGASIAKRIFCGVRRNRTFVQVHGFARPSCADPDVRNEWAGDFATGGTDLSLFDGDRDMQASIREARRAIDTAFGRHLTVEEIRALTPDDIPRCSSPAPRPSGRSAPGGSAERPRESSSGTASAAPSRKPPPPAPARKKVTVNVTKVHGSAASVTSAFSFANTKVYKQAGVEVQKGKEVTLDERRSKALIGEDLKLDAFDDVTKPTSEEKALFKENQASGAVAAYFVKVNSDGSTGESFPPYAGVGFVGAEVTDDGDEATFSHELAHVLLDSASHTVPDSGYLMYRYKHRGKYKLTPDQITTIKASTYVQ